MAALWVTAASATAHALPAQESPRWKPRVRLENDAYNFWKQPGYRSDEEYTNGVKLSLSIQSAPWWGRRYAAGRPGCADREGDGGSCLATTFTLGQELYTPRLDRAPYAVPDWEHERPYFAWLYLSGTADVVDRTFLRTASVSLGVTGPPAGGALAQSVAHAVNRGFTRRAAGWETQIGFEPGVVASLRQTMLAARVGDADAALVEVTTSMGASLGNVLTAADAGGGIRVGWNLSHPWDPRESRGRRSVEAWLSTGGRLELVARNMSLDGTLFRSSRRVDRVPLVREYVFGAGVRFHSIVLGYRGVTRSREYRTGPRHHTFSAMTAGLEIVP